MGAVAKLYMGNGFLICEEMRKYLVIYGMRMLCNLLDFLIY
jgi:hypothetical protein